jgi:hypothetical protein
MKNLDMSLGLDNKGVAKSALPPGKSHNVLNYNAAAI